MFEAADTLPNMKLEVCLSEPVVLDTNVVPANIIYVVVLMSQEKASLPREPTYCPESPYSNNKGNNEHSQRK